MPVTHAPWLVALSVLVAAAEQSSVSEGDRRIDGYAMPVDEPAARYVVVSTQGRGDEAATQGRACGARRCARPAPRGSRRRPVSISAPSRQTKLRFPSSPRLSRYAEAATPRAGHDNAGRTSAAFRRPILWKRRRGSNFPSV
jgi:hypothetical protein